MTPDVVTDVGNTRVKWGRCAGGAVTDVVSLPPDDPAAWDRQRQLWPSRPLTWAVTGVHPARRDALAAWARDRGDTVRVIDAWQELPLRVDLEHPEWAGVDRLLDGVAANARRPAGVPAVLIDAGSAITVDYLDTEGTFRGGVIMPGMRLMARALHNYTALLPEVEPPRRPPSVPGLSTIAAMEVGVYWAAAGGIGRLIAEYSRLTTARPVVYLTGGDATALQPTLPDAIVWSEMTLEGARLTAEALA